jgi:hypothetical protein
MKILNAPSVSSNHSHLSAIYFPSGCRRRLAGGYWGQELGGGKSGTQKSGGNPKWKMKTTQPQFRSIVIALNDCIGREAAKASLKCLSSDVHLDLLLAESVRSNSPEERECVNEHSYLRIMHRQRYSFNTKQTPHSDLKSLGKVGP